MWLRETDYVFALIETIHIVALGLSFGTIVWVDLRLMNVIMRDRRVSDVLTPLERIARRGFAIMFASGALLFAAEPLKAYTTVAFRLKVLMLVAAGLNIWLFYRGVYQTLGDWDANRFLPLRARIAGSLSVLLWLGIIVAGRWTAYF